jgi:hypothetical protein
LSNRISTKQGKHNLNMKGVETTFESNNGKNSILVIGRPKKFPHQKKIYHKSNQTQIKNLFALCL